MKEQEKTPEEELSRDKKFILYKVQANDHSDLNKLKEQMNTVRSLTKRKYKEKPEFKSIIMIIST